MKSEDQIKQSKEETMNKITIEIKNYKKSLEEHKDMSASVHWDYLLHLKGFRDALQWVLRNE